MQGAGECRNKFENYRPVEILFEAFGKLLQGSPGSSQLSPQGHQLEVLRAPPPTPSTELEVPGALSPLPVYDCVAVPRPRAPPPTPATPLALAAAHPDNDSVQGAGGRQDNFEDNRPLEILFEAVGKILQGSPLLSPQRYQFEVPRAPPPTPSSELEVPGASSFHLHSQVDCFASVVCCPGAIFDVARPQRTAHGFVALVTSADAHTARTSDSHTLEHHRSLRTSSPRSSPPVDRHVSHRARQRLVRRKLHCSVVSRPRHSSDSSKSKGP